MSKVLKFILIFLPIILAGCSGKSPEEHLQLAREYLQQNDRQAAIIEFKNVLSKDANNVEARIELSSTYASLGYGEGTEKEAKRALEGGADLNLVAPLLVKSQKLLEKNQELIDLADSFDELGNEASIEVNFYKALAYFRLSKPLKAVESINLINEINPLSKFSVLGKIYIKVNRGDLDTASNQLSKLLTDEENFVDALFLKGQVNFRKNEYSDAISTFQRYENIAPEDKRVKLNLAQIFLKNDDLDSANSYLKLLQKNSPNSPLLNQLFAETHYKKSDYKLAKKHADFAIQNGLDIPTNRIISGISAYSLGNSEQAYGNLIVISEYLGKGHPAAKILAASQLELGYLDEAKLTLRKLEENDLVDVDLLTSAGLMYLDAGQENIANEMLNISNQDQKSRDPEVLARKAILKLSLNDMTAIDDLKIILDETPDSMLAKAGLASGYMETKQYDKALELALKWQSNTNLKVQVAGWNLAAEIHRINSDKQKADFAFREALNIYPTNPASLMYFGNQHMSDNKPGLAAEMFAKVLETSFDYMPALINYYAANMDLGTPNIGVERIAESYNRNTHNIRYLMIYAASLRDSGKYQTVINVIEQFKVIDGSVIPESYWHFLSDSYAQLGDTNKSLRTINEWIYYKPDNMRAFLRKIALYDQLKGYSQALKATREALKQHTDQIHLKMLEINFLILSGQLDTAQSSIYNLDIESREASKIKLLQGRVDVLYGNYKAAEPNLLMGYTDYPTRTNAILVFDNHIKLKQSDKAVKFIQMHLDANPTDVVSLTKLGDYQMLNDPQKAIRTYKRLIDLNKENILALNNLAWLYIENGDKESALSYSQKAVLLNPNLSEIQDTYGQALLLNGKTQEAINTFKKALELNPDNNNIKLHLEQALKSTT